MDMVSDEEWSYQLHKQLAIYQLVQTCVTVNVLCFTKTSQFSTGFSSSEIIGGVRSQESSLDSNRMQKDINTTFVGMYQCRQKLPHKISKVRKAICNMSYAPIMFGLGTCPLTINFNHSVHDFLQVLEFFVMDFIISPIINFCLCQLPSPNEI